MFSLGVGGVGYAFVVFYDVGPAYITIKINVKHVNSNANNTHKCFIIINQSDNKMAQ